MGGAEVLAKDMCLSFKDEFNISVICLDEPGLWAQEIRDAGIPLYTLWRDEGIDYRIIWELANFAKKNNIILFHAHQTTPWFYTAFSRLFNKNTRVLFEEHGRFYPEVFNWKKYYINKFFALPLTEKVVAVSKDVKKRIVRYEGVPPKKVQVIYNGKKVFPPPSKKLKESFRKQLGIKKTDFLCGMVGRFDPIKNIPMFLKGISNARKRNPSIKGVIIGDGPLLNEMKTMVEKLGLKDSVVLPGYRSNADKLIYCFDLFVMTSFSEGTSMALLEAMSAGIPQVVTAVGGNKEVVKDGETGWLIPSNDSDFLAKVIVEASFDKNRLKKMGELSKKRFLKHFTFEKMLNEYRKLYNQIAESI